MGKKQGQSQHELGTMTLDKPKVQQPRKYCVVFHNDDYTTQEFVVEVLVQFFHKTEEEAMTIMLAVHQKGKAKVGTYPKDVAETKAEVVVAYARKNSMPLVATAEPE